MLHLRLWVALFASMVVWPSFSGAAVAVDEDAISYGTEVSWPMQHKPDVVMLQKQRNPEQRLHQDVSPPQLSWLKHKQQERYAAFMEGCATTYTKELCVANDQDRIQLNARQPGWQHNFTSTGYAVVPLPSPAWDALELFWEERGNGKYTKTREYWEHGSIYTNHWKAPTYHVPLVGIDNTADDQQRHDILVDQVQAVLEKWTGSPLIPTSTYGIRVYTNGSILTPHIDRVPLVISAIVNVAQDVTEDWVLELIGHSGKAVNLTLQPGEMVLYESHSVIHGRPYPLQGSYYANVFFHFEPMGYTQQLAKRMADRRSTGSGSKNKPKSNKELFQAALLKMNADNNNNNNKKQQQQQQNKKYHQQQQPQQTDLPYYIEEDSKEAVRWRQEFIFRRKVLPPKPPMPNFHVSTTTTSNSLMNHGITKPHRVVVMNQNNKHHNDDRPHTVAARGDLTRLMELASMDPASMDAADGNGWKPLHEAARAGRLEIVQYLIETHHVNVNERTNQGKGGTPMWWAQQSGNHEVVKLLKKHGAKAIRPEL